MGSIEADSIYRVDPATNAVTGEIPIGGGPRSMAPAAGDLWVCLFDDNAVARIRLQA